MAVSETNSNQVGLVSQKQETSKCNLSPFDITPPLLTKRKKSEPYIRRHVVKGRSYYYYCHGTEKERYLGTADAILKAVKGE